MRVRHHLQHQAQAVPLYERKEEALEQVRTYKFRLKDGGSRRKFLNRCASAVNFVWNYCNEASFEQLKKHSIWLNANDLQKLTNGVGKELGLHSQVIQQVCKEYALRRSSAKKRRLSWRKSHGSRKSLGWIPCTNQNVKVDGDCIKFGKKKFKFWKSREIPENVRTVSFNEDSQGRWYANFVCIVNMDEVVGNKEIGIDLGLKTQVTLSDGRKFERENQTKKYADKLAMAQRAGKKYLAKKISAKIANIRKDWNHKAANQILKEAKAIFVGDVSSVKLVKTNMAKSVLDASWCQLKSMLEYKAKGLGIDFKEINESWTSKTCSVCLERSGPSGLSDLSVREWTCSKCGSIHDRDINAAQNILRLGHETLTKGIPRL